MNHFALVIARWILATWILEENLLACPGI
uniref:Uncharacterized protein n=1 Tax=Rhizophora mucronata TaxID=61149 RepID=A0A2P2MV13_RHIMU